MKKKYISLLFLTFFVLSTVSVTGDSFILTTLEENEYYIYENVATGETVLFNITEQSVWGTGTDAIFVNSIVSNATSAMSLIPTTFISANNFNITFGEKDGRSNYTNTAKGNFLVEGNEIRNITFVYKNITIEFVDSRIYTKYKIANRGEAVLTGEPVVDEFYFLTQFWEIIGDGSGLVYAKTFTLTIVAGVTYIPTPVYQSDEGSLVNVTESFDVFKSELEINDLSLLSDYPDGGLLIHQFPYGEWENRYIFQEKSGLPSYIELDGFSFENETFPAIRSKISTNLLSRDSSADSYFLSDYSWETTEIVEKYISFGWAFVPTMVVIAAITVLKRDHKK